MTIAKQWAAFCCRTGNASLPASVAARAELCVADHLHAAMHGARSDTGDLLRRYLGIEGESARAGMITEHATADLAAEPFAFYAGAISAVHEIDDVQQGTSLHPGSVVVAAAMAAGVQHGVSGARLIAAVAAGYEVAVRLSIAAGHRHYHYFHSTATCGAVGAAAAVAVILGLDENETANAIGMAVASASGLWEGVNGVAVTIKHLHPGMAAERGVRAARLAQLGLQAAPFAIEGEKGFLAALAQRGAHAPNETADKDELRTILVDGLSQRWRIESNIFKRYPFCLGNFEPLEGLREIMSTAPRSAADVDRVRVEMSPPSAWMVGNADPQDQFQAKFSAPYALALVLAGHDVERAPLPAELLVDPVVRRWMSRIAIEGNGEIPRRHARVTVTWQDATRTSADRPFRNLDEPAVWARFTAACRQYLGERGRELEARIAACATERDIGDWLPLLHPALALRPHAQHSST